MDNGDGEVCLGLGLGLGLSQISPKREIPQNKNKRLLFLDLSIPIHPNDHDLNSQMIRLDHDHNVAKDDDPDINFSMNFGRKKLRLTRDQTTLLEDSFRQHTTLNTGQKQTLAEKLNLKPRQVEVWFQNRRARSKLKQTEVECEILKKNCERLSDENRRLKKEVLELRSSLKMEKPQPPAAAATPFFHHNQKAACEKNGTGRGGGEAAAAAVLEVVHEP
ncbi:homeobox-leucine zipper protein HAT22-like [Salvia miltiorrhiza]|uniref:homeobox-leucine zipper protein HAT22-like n=1 Tax=Salvia miltiorrhiza TaxID=226208 RepID=UPI0025ABCF2C|nr:homeobox-leucine zipper protein HAT22-like [Salvia miltiorrhiza]